MVFTIDKILVLGHRNPDTDSSTAAAGYATFLESTHAYESSVVAGLPGPPTPQSRFVFERAGLEPPPVIDSLLPRVCDVAARRVDAIPTTCTFRDAVELAIRTDRSMLPVVDADGRLVSVFSHRRDISRFLFALDIVPLLSQLLSWNDILAMPGVSPAGEQPRDPVLRGRLFLAIEGDVSWREDVQAGDILVCGGAAVLLENGAREIPRRVILAGPHAEPTPEEIAALNALGVAAVRYALSALDFVSALVSQVQLGALNLDVGPCVGQFDFLDDVAEVVRGCAHAVPVLNERSQIVGVIARSDLAAPPKRRVVLVDHFETTQAVAGLENAEILEILDHHRVGDIQTVNPVRVDCRPLGSASTIVALRNFEIGIHPDLNTGILLLGGLLADTLCLTSPTTTPVDRDVASRLAAITGLKIKEFGLEVLTAADDLVTSDPRRIWNRDQKAFGIRNQTLAVAQLETVSLERLDPSLLATFRDLLAEQFAGTNHLLSALFVTDILEGHSWVAACESSRAVGVIAGCFGDSHPRPGWTLARGVVSRKKQIIPALLRALSEMPLK